MAKPTPVHRFLRRVAGGYYRLCGHRSHGLHLPCFRGFVMDGLCGRHLDSCYQGCAPDLSRSAPAFTTEETTR